MLVADDWQGRGLGRELLRALAVRARDERIGWFIGLVLSVAEVKHVVVPAA